MTRQEMMEVKRLVALGWVFEDAVEYVVGSEDCDCEDYPCCGH